MKIIDTTKKGEILLTISIFVKQPKSLLKINNLFFTQDICHSHGVFVFQTWTRKKREREI